MVVLPCEVHREFGAFHLPFCHQHNIVLILSVQNYGIYDPGSMTKRGRKKVYCVYQLSIKNTPRNCQKTHSLISHCLNIGHKVIPNCKGNCKCRYIVGSHVSKLNFLLFSKIGKTDIEEHQQSLISVFIFTI